MRKRKICVVTGTRAEYGLLYWTLKALENAPQIELQLCVTGMHLSPEFGLTYQEIEEDGFHIAKKVENLMSSDTPVGVSKSMGLAMISFSEAFDSLNPDLLLVVGDRFEIFAAVSAALIASIPVAHCHGGELTQGAFDDALRHAITKMSHIHFCAAEEYRKRVLQMGENPRLVFNTGSLGTENINRLKLLNRNEFEKAINFKLNKKNLLITYHPVTLERNTAADQFKALLDAIDELADTNLIFTKPNADTDGRIIIQMIDKYVKENNDKAIAFVSMGKIKYLSAMQFVDAVVGNSSSGILEAPSFKTGTIDIGDRQKGRLKAKSVIECVNDKESISRGISTLYSDEFKKIIQTVENPYDQGNTSEKIVNLLKEVNLEQLTKKEFCDIDIS